MRIRLEAEAKLCIQENVRNGVLELAWSYMLNYENSANPFEERQRTILGWQQHASIDVEETGSIVEKARSLLVFGLKPKDALHIASALAVGCTYFVTTDDHILKKDKEVEGITIIDPPALVREMDL